MFVVVSYIGSDIRGFITSPTKIIVFALIVLLAWLIGNKINSSFEHSEEELLEINREFK